MALSRYLQDTPGGTTAELNRTIQTLAKTHALALVISGDVQYIMTDDQSIYETALAIKDSKRIYDSDRRRSDGQHHLAAEEEITTWLTKAGVDTATIAMMI